MKAELELHPIQSSILRNLLFKTEARFSELNTTELSNDHFTFHVNQLLELQLITKNDKKTYQLTQKGKEFANRMDTDTAAIEKQAKVAVLLVAIRKTNGKKEYLLQQRLKQPYFSFHGFITGKVKWGEELHIAAQREFLEETGMHGTFTLSGINHRLDYTTDNQLLEDKVFFVFKVEETVGNFTEHFEGGKNIWVSKKEIEHLPNVFPAVRKLIDIAESKSLVFFEQGYYYEKKRY